MEVKTGLETNDKTVFDFSGIRISPTKSKHKAYILKEMRNG